MRRRPLIIAFCLAAAAAAGCVKTVKDPGQRFVKTDDPDAAQPMIAPPGATPPNVLSLSSNCEGRLHEVSGLLLQYYMLNQRFPAKLDEALALDPMVSGTCPMSGQPYIYVPPTSVAIGQGHLLSVYAPATDKAGKRWAVLVRPKVGQNAAAAWVVQVTADEFARYMKFLRPADSAGPAAAPVANTSQKIVVPPK